ncbi:hypothetical protein CTI12_AA286180 [Artemisia annua]|uniref:Factor of DNA methylation 1-5/IDN2 domain-containing protein n=1 Tax=Artemisia annua TaxID=35608 RepID=A0A2U1NBK2_ARTAN|nr:hypothetical protein CTI12_AA286180 [Artemisia annua]
MLFPFIAIGFSPSKKESEDLKKELVAIYKQIAELEEQLKAKTESLHSKSMELEIALQELENLQKNLTLDFNVKNYELQDATRELIGGLKGNSKRSRIGVKSLKTLDDPHGKGGLAVEELWHNKENRIASLKEGVEYIIKQWKTEKKRVMD